MSDKKQITIVGAGLMGIGIAQVFASSGYRVCLVDVSREQLDKVPGAIANILDDFQRFGIDFEEPQEKIAERIQTTQDMEEGCQSCDFVFEAVFENMDLKQSIVSDLDLYCKEGAIICSNTSVMSITEIASKAQHKERILGTHWWNPPYLIPLVEVVCTEVATRENADKTYQLLQDVGKKPIHVNKDVPGFVGNRLQHALWREAFALIDDGICDPQTVDDAIKSGFGLRLPILGPVENADMIGLDLTLAIHNYILKFLSNNSEPSRELQAAVERGDLGFKSGKGFQEWSQGNIQKSRDRLSHYLLETVATTKKS